MCIMAPEPISTACFINPPHQSVSLYVCIPIVARQLLVQKGYRRNKYIRYHRKTVGRVVFYAVRVLSKEDKRLVLLRTFVTFSYA
jgi:hypothetical protein